MSTGKIVLQEKDEFMSGYVPVYTPIMALLLGKSKQYLQDVGSATVKRLDAVGDIRNRHYNPKDTEIKEIAAMQKDRTFKKYFLAGQFRQSSLQDKEGVSDVLAQVLDEHNKHQDDLLFLGEGTSASNMINNGLFWSNDPNYVLEDTTEVDDGSADDHLADFHTKIMVTVKKSNRVAGRKVLFVYGDTAIAKLSAVYSTSPVVFKKVLADAMGANWSIVEVPSDIALGSVNGWIAVNLDQIMLHYTTLPILDDQGLNAENKYFWHNFLMGSCMVEVLAMYGIVRQPCTFAA